MKWLAILVVLASCGDNLPDPGTPRSGERLKLGWYVYEDGTRQRETAWYYDRVLDTTCTASEWSDGNHYCAPPSDKAVYVGDTCTRALGRTRSGMSPAPFYTTSFYLLGQGLPSRVFRRGQPAAAPFTIYEKHQNGCIGPLQPDEGYDYYELVDEVTGLVQLQRGTPRGTGSLALVDELSEDGLRVPIAFYDRTLEVECTPADHASAQSVACVPNDSALISYFHEVGCLEPELVVTDVSTPTSAKQYSEKTRCWSYYEVGEEVAAPPLYVSLGGTTCAPAAPPPGARFYLTAGPLQTQGLFRVTEPTTRRLAGIELVRDELRIDDRLLYDRELDVECERDAELRCVPRTEAKIETYFFQDAGCSIPMELALVPGGECDAPSKYGRKGDTFHTLLAPYTGTIYWLSTGDTCGIYGPPLSFVPYVVGPPLDVPFMRAELTIDP